MGGLSFTATSRQQHDVDMESSLPEQAASPNSPFEFMARHYQPEQSLMPKEIDISSARSRKDNLAAAAEEERPHDERRQPIVACGSNTSVVETLSHPENRRQQMRATAAIFRRAP